MLFPHLRPDEKLPTSVTRTVGICVFTHTGKRVLFPGGTIELATHLLRDVMDPEILYHPKTRVEFGVAEGKSWTCISPVVIAPVKV